MANEKKRKSEATPAANRLRVENSLYNQPPEKRKTEQKKPAIEGRMRRNNQSPEKQKTEREKHVIQRKGKRVAKKNRGRKGSCEEEKQGTNDQKEESQEK